MGYSGMTWVAGIDYSLTSPAICVAEVLDNNIKFQDCRFHYIKQTKSQDSFKEFNAYEYPKYSSEIERYIALADWTIERIRWYNGRVESTSLNALEDENEYVVELVWKCQHTGNVS